MLGVISRISILVFFLTLQTLFLTLDLFIFVKSIAQLPQYMRFRQWIVPIGITLLGVILVPVIFTNVYSQAEGPGNQCHFGLDADVAGDGVRIAAWVQICLLIIVSILGNFHSGDTGAKEIGGGLILTHVSLALALVIQVRRNTLTLVDAAVGSMILDAQNMALSIQLVAKETLAARWQVGMVFLSQILGLAVLPSLTTKIFDGSLAQDECQCLTVFWWAWLSNCSPSSKERAVFWLYFALRCVGFVQTSFHAVFNTRTMHEAEPKCGDEGDLYQKKGGVIIGITYPYRDKDGLPACYSEYPATLSIMYALYGLLALTSLSAAEMAMHDLNLLPTSSINSIGQIIALVIAISTAIRANWLFITLFKDKRESQDAPGFMWPFSLYRRTRPSFMAPTFRPTPSPYISPDIINMGMILKDPDDLSSSLGSIGVSSNATCRSEYDFDFPFRFQTPALRTLGHFHGLFPIPGISWVEKLDTVLYAETVVKMTFQPSTENLKNSIGVSDVAHFLKHLGQTRVRRVFMVTGLMIGRDCTISADHMGIWGVIRGTPQRIIPRGLRNNFESGVEDVLLGYQLQAITIGKNGGLITAENYIAEAIF